MKTTKKLRALELAEKWGHLPGGTCARERTAIEMEAVRSSARLQVEISFAVELVRLAGQLEEHRRRVEARILAGMVRR